MGRRVELSEIIILTLTSLITSEAEMWERVQDTHTQSESFQSELSMKFRAHRSQHVDHRAYGKRVDY